MSSSVTKFANLQNVDEGIVSYASMILYYRAFFLLKNGVLGVASEHLSGHHCSNIFYGTEVWKQDRPLH